MANINGITYYTKTNVTICFPEDKICCKYCPLYETYARGQCRRTGEYIVDDRTIGYMCPLEIEGGESDGGSV